jgi:hypothetical protein
MNTTLFASPVMLAPLQGFWRWIKSTPPHGQTHSMHDDHKVAEMATGSMDHHFHSVARSGDEIRLSQKPLRVVRILEADQTNAHVGRMVISGRMADVCAELDRLAAREAALH